MSGYIKLHRQLIEWEWYDDINTFRLFMHILLKANYKDKKWRGISIKRGQFLTSLDSLVKETGLSTQQIRTSLTKLISTGEVTSKPTNRNRLLTIENYGQYQTTTDDNAQQVTSQPTGKQQAGNKQATTTKELKERKKEKKSINNTIGCRWKEEFATMEYVEYAMKEYGWGQNDTVDVMEEFQDYWIAVPGQKGVKLDWLATWRTWCRNKIKFEGEKNARFKN